MKTFDARTRERWRRWLAKNHASESEVWLIFHKKHTGKPSVAYKDALDEALCYGWIDSLIKRIDDDRYARKFTPRKAESNWSSINIKRYNELKAAKKLAAPGLARSPEGRPVVDGASSASVPAYMERALKLDAKGMGVLRESGTVASQAVHRTGLIPRSAKKRSRAACARPSSS